jgi:site-specific DNA-methyltransferase (adenine-specific)
MPQLKEKSFDLILSDPPYGITACDWDSVIPFHNHMVFDRKVYHKDEYIKLMMKKSLPHETAEYWGGVFDESCIPGMWENIKRVLKPGGTVALFGSQPFTSKLVMSNPKKWKHVWYWNKKLPGNFLTAKFRPMSVIEEIHIFSYGKSKYKPIMERGILRKIGGYGGTEVFKIGRIFTNKSDMRYPKNYLELSNANQIEKQHPTQKPVALMEYLIRTYTDQGDHVLDFCMGSGSTGVACQNTGRHFTGIEIEEKYYKIAQQRMRENRRLLVIP